MIKIKTDKEVELLRRAGEITKNTLLEIEKHIKPGVTTKQLDEFKSLIYSLDKKAFLMVHETKFVYNGFFKKTDHRKTNIPV